MCRDGLVMLPRSSASAPKGIGQAGLIINSRNAMHVADTGPLCLAADSGAGSQCAGAEVGTHRDGNGRERGTDFAREAAGLVVLNGGFAVALYSAMWPVAAGPLVFFGAAFSVPFHRALLQLSALHPSAIPLCTRAGSGSRAWLKLVKFPRFRHTAPARAGSI